MTASTEAKKSRLSGINWNLALPSTLAGLTLFGSIVAWFVTIANMQFQESADKNAISVLQSTVKELSAQSEKGRADRAALEKNVAALEGKFCEEDNIRNLMHAYDNRQMAMLWKKSFDTDMPLGGSFYPFVCESASARGSASPGP